MKVTTKRTSYFLLHIYDETFDINAVLLKLDNETICAFERYCLILSNLKADGDYIDRIVMKEHIAFYLSIDQNKEKNLQEWLDECPSSEQKYLDATEQEIQELIDNYQADIGDHSISIYMSGNYRFSVGGDSYNNNSVEAYSWAAPISVIIPVPREKDNIQTCREHEVDL